MEDSRGSNDERSAFERYILTDRGPDYLKRNDPTVDSQHDYEDDFVQEAWEAWLARSAEARSAEDSIEQLYKDPGAV
jgi:hypothetical protein